MINHARTLLLNVPAAPYQLHPGEEYIPDSFQPLTLPGYLQTVRQQLFGYQPDRLALNYRAQQYMQLLHSTELVEFVHLLDRRITYDPSNSDLFAYLGTNASAAPVDLGQVAAALGQIGEANLLQLFAVGTPIGSSEPFQTFANLWNQNPELPYQLGGLLLAVIWQTDFLWEGTP